LPLAGCSLFLANLAHADQLVPISTNRAADRCLGAGRLLNQTCQNNDLRGTTLILSPQQAAQDKSSAYADQCWWLKRLPNQFPTCQYGSTDKQAKRVALIGNSHAGPWLSPLQDFAKTDNFSITTYLASECFPSTLGLVFEGYANASASCLEYTRRTIQAIKQNNTDLVIISAFLGDRQLVGVSADKRESAVMTMWQTMLTDLADSGISVLVIRDLPSNLNETPDCVAAHRNDLSLCDWPRPGEGQVDWLYQAALQLHRPTVSTLDLTDGLCDNTTCYSVLGGVITFFNQGHLSSTFARTLTPWLRTAVNRALAATG
jgi:hypothetical protein